MGIDISPKTIERAKENLIAFTNKEFICRVRKERGIGQTELVQLLKFDGIVITGEKLAKIEWGIQHIQTTQLRAIRDALNTTYYELLRQ